MFKLWIPIVKWLDRRKRQKEWEEMITILTNGPATGQIGPVALSFLYDLIVQTMCMYSSGNYVNKQTLRLIYLLKRVLADKRQYDSIKALEYFVNGHAIYKKKFMNKEVRERLVAHCWQIVALYKDLILNNKPSNPFAPGQALGEKHE